MPKIKSLHKNASRSRHLIKQAFGELLNEKDLAKITVTDIVDRANISRGTFYAHYLDVYDLYTAIQNNVLETMEFGMETLGIENIICDPTDAIKTGMEFLSKNKNYYSLFVNSSYSETFFSRAFDVLAEKYKTLFQNTFDSATTVKLECFMYYTLGAYKEVLVLWFAGKLNSESEECAQYLIDFYLKSRPQELLYYAAQQKEKQAAESEA